MKYVLIPYIALGLVFSNALGIQHNCDGPEIILPTYYGSPFVYMQTIYGHEIEYSYSISGILLNVIIWSLTISIIDVVVKRLIEKVGNWANISYIIIINVLVLLTTFVLMLTLIFGSGDTNWTLKKGENDGWYPCESRLIILDS